MSAQIHSLTLKIILAEPLGLQGLYAHCEGSARGQAEDGLTTDFHAQKGAQTIDGTTSIHT